MFRSSAENRGLKVKSELKPRMQPNPEILGLPELNKTVKATEWNDFKELLMDARMQLFILKNIVYTREQEKTPLEAIHK